MFLEVSQLDVRYAQRSSAAVSGVSLGLAAGEIGVLIGPSGCGKTTLLRAVAGLEPLSAGTITLDGEVVGASGHSTPPEQRRIGMVFQDYALFPHLTVGRNVAFGIHRLPAQQRQGRVCEVLALVGLEGSEARFPHELSGGQQQRVALARALAPRPRLMLLDEPFSNLDVELRERLAYEVRAILQAAGATAVFVTHDQLEAFAIGDRIGVMQAGCLHQWADAVTLYRQPATRFVADFIGHGAFVPATLDASGCAQTPLGQVQNIQSCSGAVGVCDVMLRADDVVLDDHAPTQARLLRKSFRGALYLYTLELASGQTLLARVPSDLNHAPGDWLGVRVQPQSPLMAFPSSA